MGSSLNGLPSKDDPNKYIVAHSQTEVASSARLYPKVSATFTDKAELLDTASAMLPFAPWVDPKELFKPRWPSTKSS
jgi:hypothetical protein